MKKLMFFLFLSSTGFAQTIDVGFGLTGTKVPFSAFNLTLASRNIYKDFGAFTNVKFAATIENVAAGINYNFIDNLTISAGGGIQKKYTEFTIKAPYKYIPSYQIAIDYHFYLTAKNAVGFQVGYDSESAPVTKNNGDAFFNLYYSYKIK